MNRLLASLLALLLAGTLVACGGESEAEREQEGEGTAAECEGSTEPLADQPELPPDFPTPDGVVYTGAEEAGPSQIVEATAEADLGDVYEAYLSAFPDAGYDVTFDEREADDAEVNFAGGGSDGQVRLRECSDRTAITITIRPEG
jgi:hypothetical protein